MSSALLGRGISTELFLRRLAFILALVAFAGPASAAGVDSRAYTCSGLEALIKANKFVFLSNPDFQDFAVSDIYYCSLGGTIQIRTVATQDSAECPVNYCVPGHGGGD